MESENGKIYLNAEAEKLKKYKTVDDWLTDVMSERTGSKYTEAAYLNHFHGFLGWTNENVRACVVLDHLATPDDIMDIAVGKLKDDVTSKWAERVTKKWFNWMCGGGGLARTTAKMRYGVVRSFFRHNGIRFTGKTPMATVTTRYVLPAKSKLQEMWNIAGLFMKVRIGMLNDTGLRPSDVVSMDYGAIRDSFEEKEEYIYIESVSGKEQVSFAVCLTRPTTRLMHTYFSLRTSEGEDIADDSPIITERYRLGNYIGVNQLYRDISGLGKRVGVKMSPKYFRKRFRTECTTIIGRDATMKMAGWKIPGVGSYYFLPPKAKTIESYRKIERIICLEDVATDLDITAQRRMSAEMLRAAGLNPEELLARASIGDSVRDQADFLTRQLIGLLNIVKTVNNVKKQTCPETGPVSLV